MEIMGFSIPAFIVWGWCTDSRWQYDKESCANALKMIIEFVGSASWKNNDRILRIIAVNASYDTSGEREKRKKSGMHVLQKYFENRESSHTLHQVTYADIRNNC